MLMASPDKTASDAAIDSNHIHPTRWTLRIVSESVGINFTNAPKAGLRTSQFCLSPDSLWFCIFHKILAALPAEDEFLDPPISGYFPTVPNVRKGGH